MSKANSFYKQFLAAILEAKIRVLKPDLVKQGAHCTYVQVPPMRHDGREELTEALERIHADEDLMKNVKKIANNGDGHYTIEIRVEDFYGGRWPT